MDWKEFGRGLKEEDLHKNSMTIKFHHSASLTVKADDLVTAIEAAHAQLERIGYESFTITASSFNDDQDGQYLADVYFEMSPDQVMAAQAESAPYAIEAPSVEMAIDQLNRHFKIKGYTPSRFIAEPVPDSDPVRWVVSAWVHEDTDDSEGKEST